MNRGQWRILRLAVGVMLASILLGGCASTAHNDTREGFVALHRGECGAASAPLFEQAVKADPNDAQAFFGLGVIHDCGGQYTAAIPDFTAAIRLDPTCSDYLDRGIDYANLGNYADGLADINEAIRLEPESASTYYARANLYSRSEQIAETQADLAKLLSMNGESSTSSFANAYAWILATSPAAQIRNGPVALRYATDACKMTGWSG